MREKGEIKGEKREEKKKGYGREREK